MIETYINFKKLSGDELDKDFLRFCIEKGFNINSGCSINPIASITGHDSYIVSQEDNEEEKNK